MVSKKSAQSGDEELGLTDPLVDFLHLPLLNALLSIHPNTLCLTAPQFNVPKVWRSWWDWASAIESSRSESKWSTLLKAYNSGPPGDIYTNIPPDLCDFIATARRLQLDRTPVRVFDGDLPYAKTTISSSSRANIPGMSPKKSHEVTRMASYIAHLTSSSPELKGVKHVVDVGAGQGYLSRALCELGFHVLALDGNSLQTKGAERRDRGHARGSRHSHHVVDADTVPAKGTLAHKTNHITASTLEDAVSSWLGPSNEDNRVSPVPVLIVALHACGTLTPEILRAFLACRADALAKPGASAGKRFWSASAAIVVGCCYNLMSPEADFPLSKTFSHSPRLTTAHLQLAAQMPGHWLDSTESTLSAELSVKKVTYRALLEAFIQSRDRTRLSQGLQKADEPAPSGPSSRIGRLPDSAYTSFPHFLSRVSANLGHDILAPLHLLGHSHDYIPQGFEDYLATGAPSSADVIQFATLQQRVEVLHILRCLTGPSIESAIMLDRVSWLRETLQDDSGVDEGRIDWDVQLVGLFDQASGSARNMALLVAPS